MGAFRYSLQEAAASLWRGRRASGLAVLTIAAGLFLLGFFLTVNAGVQGLASRWAQSAEFAVYLRDDVTSAQVQQIEAAIDGSGLAASRRYFSKEQAAQRFAQDFPDLAPAAARLAHNPFPASVEVRVRPELAGADESLSTLAATLGRQPGVADVRYDRRWLSRLHAVIRVVRALGIAIVVLLACAAALTVSNVVRLAAHARRDEIEIMQLVGAPLTYVRGPLVLEGMLQGGAGALLAIAALGVVSAVLRARYGAMLAEAVGTAGMSFLPIQLPIVLLLGGMLLGSVGGLIVARAVR